MKNTPAVCLLLACFWLLPTLNGSAFQKQDHEKRQAAQSYELVPADQWITDFDARLALARILAYADATLNEALREYRLFLKQRPDYLPACLETARILIRKGVFKEALALIKKVRDKSPADPETLVALADAEADLGHAAQCREHYRAAMRASAHPEKIELKLADKMNMWGDFYKAEAIYRKQLKTHPSDSETALQLAALLKSTERYGEAEAICAMLLSEAPDKQLTILARLAGLKYAQKNMAAAEKLASQCLALAPDDPEALFLKADIAMFRKRHAEALTFYAQLSEMKCCRPKGLIGMGKAHREQGKTDLARACFIKALDTDSGNAEARFHAAGPEKASSSDFVNILLQDKNHFPAALEKWARLYAEHGFIKTAIKCHEAALKRDPDYFPSQIGLAETLAIDHQYDRAAKRFEILAQTYPANRKILIGWARALGWGKRYEESIALYGKIHAIAPSDPIPQIEKARTAAWAQKRDLAIQTYNSLTEPPVDRQLAGALAPAAGADAAFALVQSLDKLNTQIKQGSVYQGFESFEKEFENLKPSLSQSTVRKIERMLIRLHPSFVIQKTACLERAGKHLAWNKRFIQAMAPYEQLLEFTPGNGEAGFDHAQIECALGLCQREQQSYKRLLEVDKRHNLAAMALERLEIRRHPSFKLNQSCWSERGRDDLTEIDRYRTDLELDAPVDCRFHLKLAGHHWIEHPGGTHESIAADGFTLGASGILNPYIGGEAGWTRKMYDDDEFGTTDTGYARVRINMHDYAVIGLGYERTDELYNHFGIKQGIQADSWRLSCNIPVTGKLEITGTAEYLDYNDGNDGRHYTLEGSYAFSDHPRVFKVSLSGEYRNTRQGDMRHYEDGRLVDITHPYWTPQDYHAGAATFEWYHDLSEFLFCGSQRHFYDLALTLGTDTEHNPSAELLGQWHYEFLDHWTFALKGLIHRSELWDAEGVWAYIRYQF